MHKSYKTLTLAAVLTVALAANGQASNSIVTTASAADSFTVNELIENTYKYDGRMVVLEGEAIGEVLERGEYSWINVSDGSNAIGFWLETTEAGKIAFFGDYKHIGDTVRITGTFSRNCPEHGGDVDIHCKTLEIVKKGIVVEERIDLQKIVVGGILFLAMLITLFVSNSFRHNPTKTGI